MDAVERYMILKDKLESILDELDDVVHDFPLVIRKRAQSFWLSDLKGIISNDFIDLGSKNKCILTMSDTLIELENYEADLKLKESANE